MNSSAPELSDLPTSSRPLWCLLKAELYHRIMLKASEPPRAKDARQERDSWFSKGKELAADPKKDNPYLELYIVELEVMFDNMQK